MVFLLFELAFDNSLIMSLDIVLELLLSDCFFLGRCTDRSEDCIRFRMSHHLIHIQEDTFDYKWLDKPLSPLNKKNSHKIYILERFHYGIMKKKSISSLLYYKTYLHKLSLQIRQMLQKIPRTCYLILIS